MKTRKNVLILTIALLMGVGCSQILLAQPPTEGLKLWLKADDGAMKADPANPGSFIPASVGEGVTLWQDKSGSGHDGTAAGWGGNPILVDTGSNKAIRFNGNAGFLLADTLGMRLTTMSIYAVAKVDIGAKSQIIIGNYSDVAGYGLGISDGFTNKVKWFTAANWSGNSMEPTTLLNDPNRYTIINASYDPAASSVEKVVYFDGTHVAKGAGTGLSYYAASVATVGGLFDWGAQKFTGNVCEILVYDAVHPDQYFAVHNYLSQKYGITFVNDYQGDDPSMVYLRYLFMQSADDQGVPLAEGQAWNTTQLYDGAYWDIAVLDGTIANMEAIADPNLMPGHVFNSLINGDIELEMRKGNTYTYAFTGNGPTGFDLEDEYYSMSFYIDQKETPGVTIFAQKDADGPSNGNPDFGYPAAGPVIWKSATKGIQVRVTDFVLYPKAAPDVELDVQTEPWLALIGSAQPYIPDGTEDIVGEFTLSVEEGSFTCAEMDPYYAMDFNHDCYVDLQDLARLSQDWLKCSNPSDADCTWPIE